MNLIEYDGKIVTIRTRAGEYVGRIGDYINPEDNEPYCVEAIVLDDVRTGQAIQFNRDEILSIKRM